MGMFSRLRRKPRPQIRDAQGLYAKLMQQSRRPDFYSGDRIPDSYEGRIEVLTLHISTLMYALRNHGENGEKLSQALFDVMVDDFDSALRGEGLTDSGVKRRIKPIVELFYGRLKAYTEGLNAQDLKPALVSGQLDGAADDILAHFSSYISEFSEALSALSLGDIALCSFSFPKLT